MFFFPWGAFLVLLVAAGSLPFFLLWGMKEFYL